MAGGQDRSTGHADNQSRTRWCAATFATDAALALGHGFVSDWAVGVALQVVRIEQVCRVDPFRDAD